CTSLTSITIPDSVTNIGTYAFQNCTALESVTIGSGVTNIGTYAFYNCSNLVEVYNLSSLNLNEDFADSYVTNYALNVYTSKDETSKVVTNENGYTFYEDGDTVYLIGYTGTDTELTLPEMFNNKNYDISQYAFYNCTSLRSITIPNGVNSIGDYAFYGCSSLTSVEFPVSLTSIGNKAFYCCTALTSITIPDNMTSIGNDAFFGCTKLIEVYNRSSLSISYNDNSYVARYALNVYTPAGGESKLAILNGYLLFYENGSTVYLMGCVGADTELTLPTNYHGKDYEIKSDAFTDRTTLESITVNDGNTAYASYDGILYNKDKTQIIYVPKAIKGAITIPDSVTSIGIGAFNGCTALTSITIPNSVASIGSNAFNNCTSLKNVTIPNSVTSIGKYAFNNCTSLTSITIPNSVTSIGNNAFNNCTSLTSITIPNSVASIGSNAFHGCPIENATVPASSIAFIKNISLKTVEITSGKSISSAALSGCALLESVAIPDYVTTIGNNAFSGCASLKNVTIGSNMKSIGYSAFDGCTKLVFNEYDNGYYLGNANNPYVVLIKAKSTDITSCTIHTTTKLILGYAFNKCTSLTNLTIPDSVTNIGDYAFRECTSLESVTIGSGVTSIGNYAFFNCNSLLKTENGVQYVDKWVIDCDVNATQVTLRDDTVGIADYAFYECTALTSITIPDGVTEIGNSAFYNCSSLTTITIPDSVTQIGDYAFDSNCPIESATIPANVISYIPKSKLKTVIITDGEIERSAFDSYTSLESVTIGSGVTGIGENAFYNTAIYNDETNWVDGILTIDGWVVAVKSNANVVFSEKLRYAKGILDNVTYTYKGVTYTGYTLTGVEDKSIEILVIPDTITEVAEKAFDGCTSLIAVYFPESVTTIGNYAFWGCINVNARYFEGGLPKNLSPYYAIIDDQGNGLNGSYVYVNVKLDESGLLYTENTDPSTQTVTVEIRGYAGESGNVTIPETLGGYAVTSIAENAFLCNSLITGINIEASIDYIPQHAFHNAINMVSFTAKNVEKIDAEAFKGCTSLKTVTINNDANIIITDIGVSAFENCTSLEIVTLPLTSIIRGNAFAGCSSLTQVSVAEATYWYVFLINFDYIEEQLLITYGTPVSDPTPEKLAAALTGEYASYIFSVVDPETPGNQ
ncbi:MAG: leucine-rich repeat protein, partial [Candidatus Coproplasma sp.]